MLIDIDRLLIAGPQSTEDEGCRDPPDNASSLRYQRALHNSWLYRVLWLLTMVAGEMVVSYEDYVPNDGCVVQ